MCVCVCSLSLSTSSTASAASMLSSFISNTIYYLAIQYILLVMPCTNDIPSRLLLQCVAIIPRCPYRCHCAHRRRRRSVRRGSLPESAPLRIASDSVTRLCVIAITTYQSRLAGSWQTVIISQHRQHRHSTNRTGDTHPCTSIRSKNGGESPSRILVTSLGQGNGLSSCSAISGD